MELSIYELNIMVQTLYDTLKIRDCASIFSYDADIREKLYTRMCHKLLDMKLNIKVEDETNSVLKNK